MRELFLSAPLSSQCMLSWADFGVHWVSQVGSQKEADPTSLVSVDHQAQVGELAESGNSPSGHYPRNLSNSTEIPQTGTHTPQQLRDQFLHMEAMRMPKGG